MDNFYIVSDEDLDEIAEEETEEEIIRLMRWQEELRRQGNNEKADELTARIELLERCQQEPYAEE